MTETKHLEAEIVEECRGGRLSDGSSQGSSYSPFIKPGVPTDNHVAAAAEPSTHRKGNHTPLPRRLVAAVAT